MARIASRAEDQFRRIRTTTIVAIFSDKLLTSKLVLKGGNLLDLVFGISPRSSLDIDFSMEDEFELGKTVLIGARIKRALDRAFAQLGYRVFDFAFYEKPKMIDVQRRKNWGGYSVEFKLIERTKLSVLRNEQSILRRNATVIGPSQRRTFNIDISKFEFCSTKEKRELEGTTIFVYTPMMAIFEKLRAICQQFPEYSKIQRTHPHTARARDFIDIFTISEAFRFRWTARENKEILQKIFYAKRVPIDFIKRIRNFREFHRQDFDAVKSTVNSGYNLRDFDYYFDYVLKRCEELESSGII